MPRIRLQLRATAARSASRGCGCWPTSITPAANSPPASSKINSQARRLAQSTPSRIEAALEAIGRIAVQVQPPGGVADRKRIELGRFDQHVAWCAAETSVSAPPITPPMATGRLGVGDHAHARPKSIGLMVDGLERFAAAAAARTTISPPVELGQIEGVQRLAALHQHVVGDVDDVVDRRDADRRQPRGPATRARPDLARRESPGPCSAGRARGSRARPAPARRPACGLRSGWPAAASAAGPRARRLRGRCRCGPGSRAGCW